MGHRLMASKVLTASAAPTDALLRTYAHCGRTRGKATLLLGHLNEAQPQYVTLDAMEDVQAYVLTAPGGDRLSTGMLLNGKILEFVANELPEMNGVAVDTAQPFVVPPLSVTFLEFGGAPAAVCGPELIV